MSLREPISQPGPASAPGAAGTAVPREWLWLLAILAVGTLFRLGAWYHHALDPDEGAQLMDGRFVLRGLVPFVDFSSRQLLYALLMAAFIGLVGPDYERVRLFVVLADPLNAALIFALGRRLFDARVGLLAAAAYLFFPLAAGSAPIVHTESFAIFFACAAAYCLLRHLEPGGGWGALLAAGILVAAGVYVRESGLAIALAALLTLAALTWRTPGALARRYAIFAGGFLVPCAGVALYYSRFLSAAAMWRSHINPFYVPLVRSRGAAGLLATVTESLSPGRLVTGALRRPQPWWATWQVLGDVALVYAPLVVGAALSIVTIARRRSESGRLSLASALLLPWAISLAAGYMYWTASRGFFPEYAIELVPPLALLFAFAVFEAGRSWRVGPVPGSAVLVLGAGTWTILAASHLGAIQVPRFMYVAIVPLAMSWPWLREKGIGRWALVGALVGLLVLPLGLPSAWQRMIKLIAVGGLVVVGWVAVRVERAPGQARLGPLPYLGLVALSVGAGMLAVIGGPERARPGGEWTPSVVQEIADTLRRRGRATDEVISGGVIWEFQAGLEPFDRITHPLRFEFGMSLEDAAALADRLKARPPRFIILDGYTERSYGAVLPDLARIVSEGYDSVVTVRGGVGMYAVRLYELREGGPSR
jgi:4-amino-4-deoxy-L-arabinose transferase-like glycosyltransferase